MCDDLTAADNDRLISRRAFGAGAAAIGAVAFVPMPANALPVKGREVTVTTPDGTADAYYVTPDSGKHPAVLVWPDIGGLRPAFRQMADRLAASGYAVLTVNPFYRSAKAPYMEPGDAPDGSGLRARVGEYRKLMTPDANSRDAVAFIGWLDKQPQVDTRRGVGTTGYCMGGPLVMRTAAAVPSRVKGAGTFHGGGMAADDLVAQIPKMKASYLVAIAANDDARAPADKDKLRAAFAAAKLPAEIEVYAGTNHGWCPLDSRVYDQAQADKAWERLLNLFKTAL